MRFDRVITNPPFSQNYDRDGIPYPERFRYGWTPEGGKKADLMFVQHMLAVLKPDGIVATVMPHGVLFRGGEEARSASGSSRTTSSTPSSASAPTSSTAPASPPPSWSCGQGIEAARAAGQGAVHQRRRRVRGGPSPELPPPRAQREDRRRLPRLRRRPRLRRGRHRRRAGARTTSTATSAATPTTRPPPEPHDVRAHLHGGVPAELDSPRPGFAAHGFDLRPLRSTRRRTTLTSLTSCTIGGCGRSAGAPRGEGVCVPLSTAGGGKPRSN